MSNIIFVLISSVFATSILTLMYQIGSSLLAKNDNAIAVKHDKKTKSGMDNDAKPTVPMSADNTMMCCDITSPDKGNRYYLEFIDLNLASFAATDTILLTRDNTICTFIDMDTDHLLFGRDTDNDVVLNDITISRRLFLLQKHDNNWFIKNLSSSNGTIVNGERFSANVERELHVGDIISVGRIKMKFLMDNRQPQVVNKNGVIPYI